MANQVIAFHTFIKVIKLKFGHTVNEWCIKQGHIIYSHSCFTRPSPFLSKFLFSTSQHFKRL